MKPEDAKLEEMSALMEVGLTREVVLEEQRTVEGRWRI
jgi:hypothetical protein